MRNCNQPLHMWLSSTCLTLKCSLPSSSTGGGGGKAWWLGIGSSSAKVSLTTGKTGCSWLMDLGSCRWYACKPTVKTKVFSLEFSIFSRVSNPGHYFLLFQTPLLYYLSVCSNMLRYISIHSFDVVVVVLMFGTDLSLGTLHYIRAFVPTRWDLSLEI